MWEGRILPLSLANYRAKACSRTRRVVVVVVIVIIIINQSVVPPTHSLQGKGSANTTNMHISSEASMASEDNTSLLSGRISTVRLKREGERRAMDAAEIGRGGDWPASLRDNVNYDESP